MARVTLYSWCDGESFKKSWTDQKLTRCSDYEEFQLLEEKNVFKILYDQPTSWGSVCPTIYCSYSQCIWTRWKIINTKIMTSYFSASIKSLLDKTMYRDDHGYFVSLFAHEYCTQSFLSGSESQARISITNKSIDIWLMVNGYHELSSPHKVNDDLSKIFLFEAFDKTQCIHPASTRTNKDWAEIKSFSRPYLTNSLNIHSVNWCWKIF